MEYLKKFENVLKGEWNTEKIDELHRLKDDLHKRTSKYLNWVEKSTGERIDCGGVMGVNYSEKLDRKNRKHYTIINISYFKELEGIRSYTEIDSELFFDFINDPDGFIKRNEETKKFNL